MTIIGFDFSINKPAACVLHHQEYSFYGWPYDPQGKLPKLYDGSGVNIICRSDDKEKGDNISTKMRYEVKNSAYLAKSIFKTLYPYLHHNTIIGFEGLSYASSGDVVLQLGGYKYMLMNKLSELVPLENMFTYSPITVKSVAGCAKKGMGKPEMIQAFIESEHVSTFKDVLGTQKDRFMKKGGKSWIDHVDDIVDSYWVLQTVLVKEKIIS